MRVFEAYNKVTGERFTPVSVEDLSERIKVPVEDIPQTRLLRWTSGIWVVTEEIFLPEDNEG